MKAIRVPLQQRVTETSVFRRIESLIVRASAYGEPGAVIGDPGIGKSTAIEELERRNPSMMLLEADSLNGTKTSFFKIIADELAERGWYYMRPPRQSHIELHMMLIDALCRGVPPDFVLVIDEAQHLMGEPMRLLLDLCKKTGKSIIFVGNPYTLRKTKGNKDGLNQIRDRVEGHYIEFSGVPVRDIIAIAADHNVDGVEAFHFLEAFMAKRSLRRLADLLREARIFAGPSGPIRLPHLREGVKLLHGDDEDRRLLKLTPRPNRKETAA